MGMVTERPVRQLVAESNREAGSRDGKLDARDIDIHKRPKQELHRK